MSEDLWRRGAGELAELIATRAVSSREVVDAHLERIEAVNGHLNAITLVLADEARAAADAADRSAPERRAPRRPGHGQGEHRPGGDADDVRRPGAGRGGRPDRRAPGRAPARRGCDPDRAHEPAGPRAADPHRLLAARADPQPMGPGRHRGRLERRRGVCARLGHVAAGARQRRRRLAAQPRALLRDRVDQADGGPRPARDRDPARGPRTGDADDGGGGRDGAARERRAARARDRRGHASEGPRVRPRPARRAATRFAPRGRAGRAARGRHPPRDRRGRPARRGRPRRRGLRRRRSRAAALRGRARRLGPPAVRRHPRPRCRAPPGHGARRDPLPGLRPRPVPADGFGRGVRDRGRARRDRPRVERSSCSSIR